MFDFTFLKDTDIFGTPEQRLKTFDKIFPIYEKCEPTDFAILLGGFSLEEICYWWVLRDKYSVASAMDRNGVITKQPPYMRATCARLSIKCDEIKDYITKLYKIADGITIVEAFEYPQTIVNENMQQVLDKRLAEKSLIKTGKTYTVDSRECNEYKEKFKPQKLIEYQFYDKKYVKVKANLYKYNEYLKQSKMKMSNGRIVKDKEEVWVAVEPIKWIMDEEIVFSLNALFAGIQFNNKEFYNGDFLNTDIKKFLDKYFSKEIVLIEEYNKNNYNKVKKLIK